MPNRRYPPAYLRYLKARLMNLGRPGFWGTAIFLSVLGLLIQEYWANPDIFGGTLKTNGNPSDPLSSSLSPEDRAIAADIDNLSLLFGSPEQVSVPTPTINPSDNKDQNSLLDVLSKPKSADQKSKPTANSVNTIVTPQNQNLFVSQAENLLRFGATDNNQLLGLKSLNSSVESTDVSANSTVIGTGLVNQTNKSQNSNSVNTISTVSNPANIQNISTLNGATLSPITSTTSSASERLTQTSPTIISPSQTFSPSLGINSPTNYSQPTRYNNFNNGQSFSPSTGLNAPTNYIQPNTVNPQPGVYNNLNSQPLSSSTNFNTRQGYVQTTNIQPGSNNNWNNTQVLPNQIQETAPLITRTSPIIGPYTIRNPQRGVVTNTTPVVPNNYGNSIWQQPNQLPQSNFPYTRQPQGQYVNQAPNNGY